MNLQKNMLDSFLRKNFPKRSIWLFRILCCSYYTICGSFAIIDVAKEGIPSFACFWSWVGTTYEEPHPYRWGTLALLDQLIRRPNNRRQINFREGFSEISSRSNNYPNLKLVSLCISLQDQRQGRAPLLWNWIIWEQLVPARTQKAVRRKPVWTAGAESW